MNEVMQYHASSPLKTAVLFLVFRRLDTTIKVFQAIRQAKPLRLYIAADGARSNIEGEAEKVSAVRDFIMKNIDWDCEVKTLFRDENLGCKYAVSSAITWFFENVEEGIIIEDDTLPSQSFFQYCEELLVKYRNDKSIYLISADARGSKSFGMKEDYGFCKYALIWGWASWARAWKDYDPELEDWPLQKKVLQASISSNKSTVRFWKKIFQNVYKKEIDTWDYQLSYMLLKNEGKCIVPKVNLVSNIGFGNEATHTMNPESENANLKLEEIKIPLNHSSNLESEKKINQYYDSQFSLKSNIARFINKFKRLIIQSN